MIRHLPHKEIDKVWWDAQLLRCANHLFYAQSWVLDHASPGWEALVDDTSGAIMPLTWRRKWGIDYLFQPYGLQQLGVFAPAMDRSLTMAMFDAVPRRIRYWDICLNAATEFDPLGNARVLQQHDQLLTLGANVDELRKAYSTGHRRNLRPQQGVPPITTTDPRSFMELFRRTTHARYGGGREDDLVALERVMHEAIDRSQCEIPCLVKDGALLGAVCFMAWGDRTVFLKSANTTEGLEAKAIFRITDHWIERNAGSGLVLDFAGSNDPSVARFNTGFGARTTIYLRLVRNNLPPPLRWLKR